MTREEWLQKAVEKLNSNLFTGELDLINKPYQISVGCTRRDASREVFMPYQGEDPTLDDFFPPTIVINHLLKDPVEILAAVSLGCIQAFYGHQRCNKKFRKDAERFYFEFNKREPIITDYLKSLLLGIYGSMVKTYGDFPGKAVTVHKDEKEKVDRPKRTLTLFCPDCDYELKVSRRTFEKHGQKLPTCVCGHKMAVDLSDEEEINEQE